MADGVPDILLIPGFMLDADLWREVRPGLAGRGRVVDVDTSRDDTIGAMAARAVAGLDGPCLVIGFSMGGYVAREIVYRAPQLVRGLVLIATSSRGDDPERGRGVVDPARFRTLSRTAVMRSLHPAHRSDALIARVQAMSRRLGGEVFARQSRLRREDDTARLSAIGCRTLVIAAAQDELRTLAESEVLQRNIPDATLTVIGETGHLIPLEQPGRLLEALAPVVEI